MMGFSALPPTTQVLLSKQQPIADTAATLTDNLWTGAICGARCRVLRSSYFFALKYNLSLNFTNKFVNIQRGEF